MRARNRMRMAGVDGIKHLTTRTPTGVVTAFDAEARPWGATCVFIASVTHDPPTVLVTLSGASPTAGAALTVGEFALNVLPRGARATTELFASEAPDAFDRIDWTVPRDATGPHLHVDAQAVANCTILGHAFHGEQITFVAEVCRVLLKPTLLCGWLTASGDAA
ncbi:flavin reductase family protein [Streptomyces rubiginosohelvolus]|uniref:flavin reductase family protein n=1 Tax=Streptomyces rubiginosohelvolus TaxID=67362 RepID=UPI0036DCB707